MASNDRYEKNEEVLSKEEKKSLDELINKHAEAQAKNIQKQTEGLVAKTDDGGGIHINMASLVTGLLQNKTSKGPLYILTTYKWEGHTLQHYTNPFNIGVVGSFLMTRQSSNGVKAAVVFTGRNVAGLDCGWLLAFADTKDLNRRIYADVGLRIKFYNINWGQIEEKLNTAGVSVNAYDSLTGARLIGQINVSGDQTVVAADFTG